MIIQYWSWVLQKTWKSICILLTWSLPFFTSFLHYPSKHVIDFILDSELSQEKITKNLTPIKYPISKKSIFVHKYRFLIYFGWYIFLYNYSFQINDRQINWISLRIILIIILWRGVQRQVPDDVSVSHLFIPWRLLLLSNLPNLSIVYVYCFIFKLKHFWRSMVGKIKYLS